MSLCWDCRRSYGSFPPCSLKVFSSFESASDDGKASYGVRTFSRGSAPFGASVHRKGMGAGWARRGEGSESSVSERFTLYGDDFDAEAIARWFAEEAAYHDQFEGGRFVEHPALYRWFDWELAFKPYFHPEPGACVLDFGCAEGHAFDMIPPERGPFKYVGVDASATLIEAAAARHPDREFRLMPSDGHIPAQNGEFDYAIVLGVLHHVPNVRHYLAELARILRPGGTLILREPNHAMGRPVGSHRMLPGLSPNERGIPAAYLVDRVQELGLRPLAVRPAYHGALLKALGRIQPKGAGGWRLVVRFDQWLCRATAQRARYDRPRLIDKLAPTATYLVAVKS